MTMTKEQIIESAVNDFTTKTESFSSVDIGNTVKRNGTWVRNREVATWLRGNFKNSNYKKSQISVDGNGTTAMLYHPDFIDPSTYTGQNQRAITPDEFEQLHPMAVAPTPTPDVPLIYDDSDNTDDKAEIKICNGRIWIPAFLISKLGLQAKDTVDCSKIAGITGAPKLSVHFDGRVSVSKNNISQIQNYVSGQKVEITFENGQIIIR